MYQNHRTRTTHNLGVAGGSTTMDSKESLKQSVANGEGNSNLTTQSSTFNLILKSRVIEPLLINYYDNI